MPDAHHVAFVNRRAVHRQRSARPILRCHFAHHKEPNLPAGVEIEQPLHLSAHNPPDACLLANGWRVVDDDPWWFWHGGKGKGERAQGRKGEREIIPPAPFLPFRPSTLRLCGQSAVGPKPVGCEIPEEDDANGEEFGKVVAECKTERFTKLVLPKAEQQVIDKAKD